MTTPASDWYIYPSCNLLSHIVRKKILLFSPGRPRRALQPAEMMCVQGKLALPGHCAGGMGCMESRLPRQLSTFLFTQTILQQLQNLKMGIMQGQIMQVRFLFCENHNSQDLCKSLFSFICWGEMSSSSSMVFLVYFKKALPFHYSFFCYKLSS